MRQTLPRNVLTRLESSRVIVYGLMAGAVVGLLGSALRVALDELTDLLAYFAGFRPPGTPGEGGLLIAFGEASLPYLLALPVLALLGVLLRAQPRVDPLEEAIRDYHNDHQGPGLPSQLRSLGGATLTYLSGLAVGRDGPFTALGNLCAGLLTRVARLSRSEARTVALSCVGAALGLVLHAPLAAAVFVVEVLYRRFEFEFEVLLPAVLASVTAYAVYGALHGFSPLVTPAVLQPPTLQQLPTYALLALAVSVAAWIVAQARSVLWNPDRSVLLQALLVTAFGLAVAATAVRYPQIIGDGTGWLQVALYGFGSTENLTHGLLRLLMLLAVAWLALGGTILSSVSAGGLLGVGIASLWPGAGMDPAVAGFVSAAAFLTTTHNVPVAATLLLASWGGDALLPPLFAGTLIAHAVSGEASLMLTQVRSHAYSPAHAVAVPAPSPTQTDDEQPLDAVEELLYRVPLPDAWSGVAPGDVVWPGDVQYVGLVRDGNVELAAPGQVFQAGDELVLLATPEQFEGFAGTLSSLPRT